jgi:hypothetical protein
VSSSRNIDHGEHILCSSFSFYGIWREGERTLPSMVIDSRAFYGEYHGHLVEHLAGDLGVI